VQKIKFSLQICLCCKFSFRKIPKKGLTSNL